ncbi:MAG: isoleucine--tRNA ligase [Thermofilum sp.]
MSVVRSIPQAFKPKEYEKEILEFWEKNRVYELLREKSRGGEKFYFLDGPPYASSGVPHVGTLWNKVLKDAVIRFWRFRGYRVHDQPGYDCHGLPIEVQVEKKLGFKTKKDIESYGVEKFIEECRSFVLSNVRSMSSYFKEFGVSMDWENPYLTLNKDYIEGAWWFVKKAEEKGLLDYGVKVVHWCPRCETSLADYEVTEYVELEDPSIYVKFPLLNEEKKYLLIWTTTPWTIPANTFVMVNPDLEYVWVDIGGEQLLLAASRLEEVMREAGVQNYRVAGTLKGEELEGLKYVHPLSEEVLAQKGERGIHTVVLSREFVSASEGTGLVHGAPGHGEEDYVVGSRYGAPVLVLVDEKGAMTEEAGVYAGIPAREASARIVETLRKKGLLFHAGSIRHRYPVCWRCKTPLLLRATRQWFIRVTRLKEEMLREAERVKWIPPWAGYARFKNWLEGLRDWIISRQRYWGIPAPIWVCGSCGHRLVVSSVKELEELSGAKIELQDLHRPWVDRIVLKCPKCGGQMQRVPDVLDVWLDSGISFFASLGYPLEKSKLAEMWPVDFIVEGHDQIAGWFYSLLRAGLIAFGEVPYRTVLMHGFALDEQGREMHKSLGNYVEPSQVLAYEQGSRDAFRWFVLKNTVWEDLRFSWRGLSEAYSDLNVLWNVYYFATLYMSIDRFAPERWPLDELRESMRPEDRWILSRFTRFLREYSQNFEEYHLHKAARLLREFVIEDLSHWYVRLVRPRVWVEEEEKSKMAAYATLHYILYNLLPVLTPILPFTAEKIYQSAFRSEESPISVNFLQWPVPDASLEDPALEKQMDIVRNIVERALALRMRKGVKVRQPLPRLFVLTDDPTVAEAVSRLSHILREQVNVKEVAVKPTQAIKEYVKVRFTPNYQKLGPAYREKTALVVKALEEMTSFEHFERFEKEGVLEVSVGQETFKLERDMVTANLEWLETFAGEKWESSYVVLDFKLSERELAEGLARDVLRRIQFMRKELNLPVDAFIDVKLYVDESVRHLLYPMLGYIRSEARARDIEVLDSEDLVSGDLVREWEIEETKAVIGVRRAT